MPNILRAILIWLLTSTACARDPLVDETIKWTIDNNATIKRQIREEQNQPIAILHALGFLLSRNDGAILPETAPLWLDLLRFKPTITLVWFKQHPNEFKQFREFIRTGFFVYESKSELDKGIRYRREILAFVKKLPISGERRLLLEAIESSKPLLID